jgi:hypothetical protein
MRVTAVRHPPHCTPAADFVDRAALLVRFLVERNGAPGTARGREQELGEWIARWQKTSQPGWAAAQHFAGEELGIILRALNGPPSASGERIDPLAHQQICWLIAKCMNQRN